MSHVRSRRRGRLNDNEGLTSEGEELESISSTDHSSDEFESSEEEVGSSSSEEEDNEYEGQSSETESETELNVSDLGTSNSKESKVTTRKTIKSSNNNIRTSASPSDTTINVQKEESTTKEESGRGESSSSSSSLSPPQLTNREKQILERREYRRKLAEDPSFVPYVGMFWSHDDRYRDDALRPALDNGPSSKKAQSPAVDISEEKKIMRHNSNRPTTTTTAATTTTTTDKNHQHLQQRRPSKSTKFSKNYRRTPDEIINSKWTHDGYDWLLRMDEKDQQQKQDRLPSQSKQFRRPNRHHKQRREQRPAVSNDVGGANSNWQSFDPKNIQTYGELDRKKKKDTNDKNESWGDGKAKDDKDSDNDGGNTSMLSPKQADSIPSDNDNWANTQAKKNWKSFSLPATDVWEPSDGSLSTSAPRKDDNKKKKNSKITSTANEKPKKKEKGIATNGWSKPNIIDTSTDSQLESAAADWKPAHDPVKGDGWETATGATPCLARESEWSSDIIVDIGGNNEEDAREGWGSVHAPKVAKGWSTTAGDDWENDTTSDYVVANDDDWKKNASWDISSNGVDDTAKKGHADTKKDGRASAAWGLWDKTSNFNSKRLDRFQQQQQQQQQRHGRGRGRGYLSQKRPPSVPPAQQQQQAQEKTLTLAQQEPKSMPEKETQTAKKQEPSTSSTTSFSQQKPPPPVCDFDSTQNAPWGNITSTRDNTWNHNKFIEDKEDQESDVEIILEADDSLSTSWDNNGHVPKVTTSVITSIVSPPEAQREPERSKQRTNDNIKQSRMDDNWRRRDDPEPTSTTVEDTNAHNNNNLQQHPPLPPNSYYYQQPMNNYMPIAAALPQAYGMPLQPVTMHSPQPLPVSAADNNTNNTLHTNDEQQFMPSAYEANGMVYYGMDPNMYQYYYCPPQPMTMPVQQGGMIVVGDDDGDHDLQEGWGATPPYEEEWEHDPNLKQEHPHRHGHRQKKQQQQQQQQQQAFYYYPTNSSQYYG